FYSPATIVKDAQRHGLKLLPVDVTCSEWNCSLERVTSKINQSELDPDCVARALLPARCGRDANSTTGGPPALRMGLRYVRGLREDAARSLLLERIRAPFTSIHDLTRRVPELRRDELTTLAEIGALNAIRSQIADFRLQISKPNQSEICNLKYLKSEIFSPSGKSNGPSAHPAHSSNSTPSPMNALHSPP
ncbi:MAG: hypothetical protein DMG78_25145, partial [Acidobacteria bacterium]